jgi:hypothetical protein
MVKSYKIYIEGGGDGKDLDIQFREAWTKFFTNASLQGKMPRPVRGKGRVNTFDLFKTAIQNQSKKEIPLLLVDAEDPVDANTVWQHLKQRDDWDQPQSATDDHAFLMIQVMETWFVADKDTLQAFFGAKFKSDKIPAWSNLESIAKSAILDALRQATQDCKEPYAKGELSFKLLGEINPKVVAEKCPEAKRLLDVLRNPISTSKKV